MLLMFLLPKIVKERFGPRTAIKCYNNWHKHFQLRAYYYVSEINKDDILENAFVLDSLFQEIGKMTKELEDN